MSVQLTNLHELSAALNHVVVVTKKAEADIVTKAAKDVAFRSAQFTPKTSPAQIRQDLSKGNLLGSLASTACNKRYGLKSWNRLQWEDMKRAIIRQRTRGVNAVRAGWIPAIQKLGGTFRGAKLRTMGTASMGKAMPATISRLVSWIENAVVTYSEGGKASGAGEIPVAVQAINRAVVSVTSDRLQYAEKKLKEANRAAQ